MDVKTPGVSQEVESHVICLIVPGCFYLAPGPPSLPTVWPVPAFPSFLVQRSTLLYTGPQFVQPLIYGWALGRLAHFSYYEYWIFPEGSTLLDFGPFKWMITATILANTYRVLALKSTSHAH